MALFVLGSAARRRKLRVSTRASASAVGDSVMRATIFRLAPQQRRATAFGIMNAVYGVAWFAGSVLLGVLYDLTSTLLQAAAIPIFVRIAVREALIGSKL
jgi:MFS-type transporter involved in bile tolerance (Atg22 family)